jgi:hypothetical protein
VTVAWTASVWGGVFGALLMLLRRRAALPLVALSLGGTVAYIVYTCFLSAGIAAMGMLWFMPTLIATATLGQLIYLRRMDRRGLLR